MSCNIFFKLSTNCRRIFLIFLIETSSRTPGYRAGGYLNVYPLCSFRPPSDKRFDKGKDVCVLIRNILPFNIKYHVIDPNGSL